ncbi:metal-dependent hydrolase [Patescibacteria group bacterium]|nr:MAG: metal-dependent hydrolase [Patescibacteria group bacterium]
MFIAHLPAGYLLTRWIQDRTKVRSFLWIGLVASIFPDIDILYFYFIDHRQTLHHEYWTHVPIVWLAILGVCASLALLLRNRKAMVIVGIVFSNIMLHFVLDTFVGGIAWLYPFSDKVSFLVTVPATQAFWVWSFLLHWTFLAEIAIIVAACIKLRSDWVMRSAVA